VEIVFEFFVAGFQFLNGLKTACGFLLGGVDGVKGVLLADPLLFLGDPLGLQRQVIPVVPAPRW